MKWGAKVGRIYQNRLPYFRGLKRPLPVHRRAILLLFALNGFLYASWAARVPEIQSLYGIDDGAIGLVLITASFGAFASMPFAAFLTERFGVSRVALLSALLYIVAVPLIPQFDSPAALYAIYLFLGVGFGLLDVAMNSEAVELERLYERSIISSFHAGFSASMIAGALVSSGVIYLGIAFDLHLLAVAVVGAGLLAYAYPRLLPEEVFAKAETSAQSNSAFRLPVRATWLIGLLGFCSMMSEASISDWSAKYMLEVAGSQEFYGPWAIAAFSVMMTVGRTVGDKLRDSIGDALILRGGAIVAFLGLGLSVAFPLPWTTVLGAALVGSGLSIAVPIVFSMSSHIPGLSASAGLSMVTTISYLGLFLGPAVIGFLTEAFGLRVGYGWILLALAVMVALAFRVAPRPTTTPAPRSPVQAEVSRAGVEP